MDFNIEIRKKQLDNLDQLISSSRNRIQSVLSYLEWSNENVQKGDPLVQCPINAHHRICPKSWNEHIEKCIIKIEGYDPKSQFLSESLDNPTQSIYIDHNKKIELITKEISEKGALRLAWNGLDPDPRTSDRLLSTYSPDERLIFYNHCVESTVGPSEPPEFTTIHNKKQDEEKLLSYEEILAQQRDAKRRRTKYKSVHINRKNHTEVIREVIDGQMEEYKEWLLAQQPKSTEQNNGNGVDDKKDDERPHSSISRNSNHSSSSRSTSRRYDRYRDRRDSSRDRHHKSRSYERKDKFDGRHRKISPQRHSSEERRHRNNHSNERRRSRERRHSSREGSSRRGHDYVRKR